MSAHRKPRVRPRISQREARKIRRQLNEAYTQHAKLVNEITELQRENKELIDLGFAHASQMAAMQQAASKTPETKKLFDLTCGPIGRVHIEAPSGDGTPLLPIGSFVSANYHGMLTVAARLGWSLRIKAEPRPAPFTGLSNNKTPEYDFIVEAVKP